LFFPFRRFGRKGAEGRSDESARFLKGGGRTALSAEIKPALAGRKVRAAVFPGAFFAEQAGNDIFQHVFEFHL
jgi:hypothetical protein